MVIFKKSFLLHLIGVIIFLLLSLILSPRPDGVSLVNHTLPAFRDLLASILMIGFFYLNYYFLVTRLFLRKKYVIYIILTFISFVVIILAPSILTGYSPLTEFVSIDAEMVATPEPSDLSGISGMNRDEQLRPPNKNSFLISISHNILLFLSVVIFSIFLRIQERLFKVEKAKNEMEILSLKEQINPHFLFNTLNNIYGQAIEDNSLQTATSILKLSEMLRYVVHDAQFPWVPIQKEMAYMENYIELQRQRLGDSVKLLYDLKGSYSESLKIAPLILIPFIENAFKHGINPDKKSLIKIVISMDRKTLNLLVENRKTNVNIPNHEKSGAGLKITLERLSMLYQNKHTLQVDNFSDQYKVNLKLELHD
ncbi:sensor histidine kinase [Cyclobacterium sediminis]